MVKYVLILVFSSHTGVWENPSGYYASADECESVGELLSNEIRPTDAEHPGGKVAYYRCEKTFTSTRTSPHR